MPLFEEPGVWRSRCGLAAGLAAFTKCQIHWRVSGIPRSERNRLEEPCRAALGFLTGVDFLAGLMRARCGRPSRR